MFKRRTDLLSLVSYALLIFVILVVVLNFVFGFKYVVILTDSMKPHINPNDLVVTRPVSPEELRKGDVILYRMEIGNGTFQILHRIVDVGVDESGRLYYRTKGDNRNYTDPWRVYPEQVVGRPVLVIPKVGAIWPYAPLIILFLVLVFIFMVAYELFSILWSETPRPKSRKPEVEVLRRKKIKFHSYRRR
ncbi:MAG: signal peptidase [Thermococcaceae archaeon]|nr:signal peptidase [Thermococcaceae archaeon]MDK2913179.1 signal peptidase [Thermococcaceae archaeon]